MTVQELIARLSQFDKDLKVVCVMDNGFFDPVASLWKEKSDERLEEDCVVIF